MALARYVLEGHNYMVSDEFLDRGLVGAETIQNPGRVVPMLGATYEARIAADPGQFLALDAPLRWQPRGVQLRLSRGSFPDEVDAAWGEWDVLNDPRSRIRNLEAAWTRSGQPGTFSDELNRRGIVGSRYRDGNSRDRTGADQHNLVVFGDDPISVTRRYQRGGLAGV
jgi:hypothetical protein